MKIVSTRTKLLLLGAALAPAAGYLIGNYVREAEYEALDKGAIAVLVHVGTPILIIFLLGVASLLLAVVSLVFDIRRSRKETYAKLESPWKL